MKVKLPTLDITDREREILAAKLDDDDQRLGKGKMATREEVKQFMLESVFLQLEGLELWWDDIGPGSHEPDEDEDEDYFADRRDYY